MRDKYNNTQNRDPRSNKDWVYRRGDIYLVNLNPFFGSEQGGTRPVVVIQNNKGNKYCPTLIVAVVTSHMKKTNLPVHCRFDKIGLLPQPSMVMTEQITTLDKRRIKRYLGKATEAQMTAIDRSACESLGLVRYMQKCWREGK